MSLKDKINDELKAAMIAKNSVRTETLRSIRAEILKADKAGLDREMTEEEEIEMLSKQAKMRRESIEQFESAGRTDLVDKEKAQLEIIGEFLPEQMSQEEAESIVDGIIKETGAVDQKDFGKVMGGAMKELKGKIDGKVIQDIVKSRLSS
jgi:uncharacterized protein YqeY